MKHRLCAQMLNCRSQNKSINLCAVCIQFRRFFFRPVDMCVGGRSTRAWNIVCGNICLHFYFPVESIFATFFRRSLASWRTYFIWNCWHCQWEQIAAVNFTQLRTMKHFQAVVFGTKGLANAKFSRYHLRMVDDYLRAFVIGGIYVNASVQMGSKYQMWMTPKKWFESNEDRLLFTHFFCFDANLFAVQSMTV